MDNKFNETFSVVDDPYFVCMVTFEKENISVPGRHTIRRRVFDLQKHLRAVVVEMMLNDCSSKMSFTADASTFRI